jgi:hypothetical protein
MAVRAEALPEESESPACSFVAASVLAGAETAEPSAEDSAPTEEAPCDGGPKPAEPSAKVSAPTEEALCDGGPKTLEMSTEGMAVLEELQEGVQEQPGPALLPEQLSMDCVLAALSEHMESEEMLVDDHEGDCKTVLVDGYEEDCGCAPLEVTVFKQETVEEPLPVPSLLMAVKEDLEALESSTEPLTGASGSLTEALPEASMQQGQWASSTPHSYGDWHWTRTYSGSSPQEAPASVQPPSCVDWSSCRWWTPQVSEVLRALADVYLSGLSCGKLIDFGQLFAKVQSGEVCIANYYSSKLFFDISQELHLPEEQVQALGVRRSLPALSSMQQADLFGLFQQLLPDQYVEECLPSGDLTKARWLCYEVIESSERPSEKDLRKVFESMSTYYKISCYLRKQPCMGIPHAVVALLLLKRKLSRREVEETVLSHKAFFEERLPYVSELSRFDLEALKERRFDYVSGKMSLAWLDCLWGKIREKLVQEKSLGADQSLPECSVYDLERLRRTGLYPELERRCRLLKQEARSSRLPHEEARRQRRKLMGQLPHFQH